VIESLGRTGFREELVTALMSIRGSLALMASGAAGPLPLAARELLAIAARNCDRLMRHAQEIAERDDTPR
jgi:hypothetical protein